MKKTTPDYDTKAVIKLLEEKARGKRETLIHVVKETIDKKEKIFALAAKHQTPFYLIEEKQLKSDIKTFKKSFDAHLPNHQAYYAIKANYHPYILKKMVEGGLGLDVSSERELKLALKAGATKMLFSGPGKSERDLELALKQSKKLILNMDSFEELHRLGKITNEKKISIRAGIRFYSSVHGAWSKFGIPLKELKKFWNEAKKYPYINLQGLHFHISLNLHAEKYCQVLTELATYLEKNFPAKLRAEIKFIDIGGGYYPDDVEGFYPWSDHYPWTLSGGHIKKLAHEYYGEKVKFSDKYFITRASSPEKLATEIRKTIDAKLAKLVPNCTYFSEPGRIVSNNSTSIVTKIMDVKEKIIITDAGINATGWEFGQHFYFPIINITNPDYKEKSMRVYGSLCTPRDFWGYYLYAKTTKPGDVLVIPNQGAYKFTLAQNFIKEIPPTIILR